MIYLFFFLIAYGIANIIVFANGPFHIFLWIRNHASFIHPHLEEMLNCMICTPFWVGVFLSAVDMYFTSIYFAPSNLIVHDNSLWYFKLFFDGCITSGTVWLIHTVQEMCERIDNNDEDIIEE